MDGIIDLAQGFTVVPGSECISRFCGNHRGIAQLKSNGTGSLLVERVGKISGKNSARIHGCISHPCMRAVSLFAIYLQPQLVPWSPSWKEAHSVAPAVATLVS